MKGALTDRLEPSYRISRENAGIFINSITLSIRAHVAMASEDAEVPLDWSVPPNNDFRFDIIRKTRITGRPILPLTWLLLWEAIKNVRQIVFDDSLNVSDGQLIIQYYLPVESRTGSVTHPDGTPVVLLAITRTSRGGAGAAGRPACLGTLQRSRNGRTRGQILYGDRYPGIHDYLELPGGP